VIADSFTEMWSSEDVSTGGRYAAVAGIGESGDCAVITEGFQGAPEIAVIQHGDYRTVRSFDLSYHEQSKVIDAVEHLRWHAADGLEIEGYLLRPRGSAPYPVIMDIHGGPVWHWRPRWLGRSNVYALMLLEAGCALFLPNPRGSSGRGQAFTAPVLGDMGGIETGDFLSGLDYLVEQGIADCQRLGVMGVSYGGFMASWLITQDARFAAAVAVAPINNFVTEHLLSNIPQWPALFFDDTYTNAGGKYFQRSPIMHAHKTKTPTLNICGALDRSAPPEEALQFHNALRENGVESVLLTYPEEGHGVRAFPALIDYAARVATWFQDHMSLQETK
jgi:dipeptidyl aminopeptidase/acylaminoacyl peptidase